MANEANAPTLYTVAAPPHWHCGRTVTGGMQQQILALLPAAVMAVVYYGFPALRVMALACATAVAVEALCCRVMNRAVSVDDFHAVLTGLLLSFLLPAMAPWWLVVIGATVSIFVGKMLFGGLGGNPLCAPLVGWAILSLSWKTQMDPDAMGLATTLVDPLTQLKYLGLAAAQKMSYLDMLLGRQLGGLGAAQVLALLAGACYLVPGVCLGCSSGVLPGRGIRHRPVYFLIDGGAYPNPIFHLFTGSVVLGPASWPRPQLLAGEPDGHGALRAHLRDHDRDHPGYGIYPTACPSHLFANLFTPCSTHPAQPFGAR
jgi:electron transport complex protein RnfD